MLNPSIQSSPDRVRDILIRILQVGLGLLFLVPFIYAGWKTFPFIVSKVIALRMAVEVLFMAALLLLVLDPPRRPKKSLVLLLLGGWVVSLLLSTAFGIDPYRSFWGNHERMTGVFTLVHFAVVSVLAAMAFPTGGSWRRLWGWGLSTSAVMAVIGFIQYFSPTGLLHTAGGGRIWATLGNYIYLAQYSLFFMFLALWFAVSGTRKYRPLALVIVIAQGLILLLSETRGALLGAAIGAIILCLWLLRNPHDHRARRLGAASLLAVAVFSAAVWLAKDTRVIRSIPGIRRVSELSLVSGGAPTRLIAWSIALEAFRARPVFGWGIENYYYAFNQYYRPVSLRYSYYETWFDRAHNAYLDLLSMQGAVGTAATIALYAGMFLVFRRHGRRGKEAYLEAGFASAILGSYLAQNFFVFDSPTSYLLFFLLAGWAIRLEWGYGHVQGSLPVRQIKPLPSALIGAAALAIVFLIFITNIQPLRANHIGLKASSAIRVSGNLAEGVGRYLQAISIPNPMIRDLRTDLARDVSEIVGNPNLEPREAATAWTIAVSELFKNIEHRPKDTYDRILLGQLYNQGVAYDPAALEKADKVLTEAVPFSPKRQQIYFTLAKTRLLGGRAVEAVKMLEGVVADEPLVPDSHWYLGLVLHDAGDLPRAWSEILRALDLNYQWKNPVEIIFTAEVAKKVGDVSRQVTLLEEAGSYFGQIGEYHARLAEAYASVGMVEKAQEESVKAVYLDESLKPRMQELLKRIEP